jgi:hypothetical protein
MKAFLTFDNNLHQLEWLARRAIPTPRSAYVTNQTDLDYFLQFFGLSFPLVSKTLNGSGVRFHSDENGVQFPCLIQELCDADLKTYLIGSKIFGCDVIPVECLERSRQVARDLGATTMCFNFLKKGTSWLLSEMSYTYCPQAIENCSFYYGKHNQKMPIYKPNAAELILKEVIRQPIPVW